MTEQPENGTLSVCLHTGDQIWVDDWCVAVKKIDGEKKIRLTITAPRDRYIKRVHSEAKPAAENINPVKADPPET